MTHPVRPTQHSSKKTPTGREHLLQEENTFYRKRTPSTGREHLLQEENTFYRKRTPSTGREHLLCPRRSIHAEDSTKHITMKQKQKQKTNKKK